jgi:hypothetical protein
LKGKTCAVVGFGAQGRAHALNLHDSGIAVIVGLYPRSSALFRTRDKHPGCFYLAGLNLFRCFRRSVSVISTNIIQRIDLQKPSPDNINKQTLVYVV